MPHRADTFKSFLVLFAGVLVLGTCAAGWWVWFSLKTALEQRTVTRMTLIAWEQIYSTMKDTETGARGYVITGDEAYLAPFTAAVEKLGSEMQTIGELERSLPEKLFDDDNGVSTFRKLADDHLSKTREIVTVTKREGRETAMALLKEGSAKAGMDAVRVFCENRLAKLDQSVRAYDRRMFNALDRGMMAVASLTGIALIASLLALMMLRESRRQGRRSDRLAVEKQKAERANNEKSVFLATMSHEIRTPMNAILGFGELLLADAADEKHRRYAGSIVRSGQALLQLINDILDLSKIEAGMLEVNAVPVSVHEIADFTRQLFSHQCASKNVELIVNVADNVPQSLLLDGARLRQIVLNLVGNAIKFTDKGLVRVEFHGIRGSGQRSSFHLKLDVADTGSGIPTDRIKDIFDPFVQAKANRDSELKGTGLGLAIVKRLAGLMHGSVDVISEEGKGATFTLDLPNVEISARLPQALTSEQRIVDFNLLKPAHIFVVDDNPTNLAVVRGYFDGSHHTITTAVNGREAVEWLSQHQADVVLMDIRMPVMDGRTALAELRKSATNTLLPVIAVTASSLSAQEIELRKTFDGYVRKPYSRAQLFDELSHFLPRHTTESPIPVMASLGVVTPEWTKLAVRLREFEHHEWPAVRAGMVIGKVRAFAAKLGDLAEKASCEPLKLYAAQLDSQGESFSLEQLEQSLASFPSIIETIETRVASAAPHS